MSSELSDSEMLAKEREVFGFSHPGTGGYLMKELNFPPAIAVIVERHHDLNAIDDLTQEIRNLLHIVMMSNRLSNTLGYGFNHEISEQEFAEDPILDILVKDEVFDVSDKVILVDEAFELRPFVDEYLSEVA